MELITIESGLIPTNGYLVIDDETKNAALIDAPLDSAQKFSEIIKQKGLNICAIFLTHSHWDHTGDALKFKNEFNAPIYIHKDDEYRIIDPMAHTIFQIPVELDPVKADYYIENDLVVECGNLKFEFAHTPGHTEGGVCIFLKEQGIAFTGDTLFAGSIGRTDLPGGSYKSLLNSIKLSLMNLPEQYAIYPGHGSVSSIGEEKLYNPFLS